MMDLLQLQTLGKAFLQIYVVDHVFLLIVEVGYQLPDSIDHHGFRCQGIVVVTIVVLLGVFEIRFQDISLLILLAERAEVWDFRGVDPLESSGR